MSAYEQLDAWIDAHFDEETRYLQALVRVPTDTPPGNNAPHAQRTAELLAAMGGVGQLPPLLAGWSPDIVFFFAGMYFFFKMPT